MSDRVAQNDYPKCTATRMRRPRCPIAADNDGGRDAGAKEEDRDEWSPHAYKYAMREALFAAVERKNPGVCDWHASYGTSVDAALTNKIAASSGSCL
jgi:hypothetical protein